ncbi:hypothetical protein [Burkholderia pseudomallei]|uniref:hypothetical protein n=1 Tax=Burkholderia pseudomallei TaxID=28450 RepID=UPI00168A613C|nr:hypothetical protein [Burkholderia pseudomallei]MBD2956683.1 hypothetical protein [Burkholderia pseudomallei]MBD2974894.1 hypothetical protein [Burkholderia pseudomallei]MBF3693465.1 hypothetical protein [Burkholderia pseudomallei]
MTALASIVLPIGIRGVPVDRVPRLIVDALYPRPADSGALMVRLLGRYPRSHVPQDSHDCKSLRGKDWARLRRIWTDHRPSSAIEVDAWGDYLYAFETSQSKPEWRLAWDVVGGAANSEQRGRCWDEHRSALSKAICRRELTVRDPITLRPEVGRWGAELGKAAVSIRDLARYLAQFGIGLEWITLPTERPKCQCDYNRSVPVNWAEAANVADLQVRGAVLLMHGLNPEVHRRLSVPLDLRYNSEAAEFFRTVRHVLSLAQAQGIAPRPVSDWLRWADDLEIVVHSDFRQLVEPQRTRRRTSGTPLSLTGVGSPTPATPLVICHDKPRKKSNILDAVIQLALDRAIDPGDYQSVWASLVRIAEAANRPAPLRGYAENEGVLYQDEHNDCKSLKKEALKRRLQHGS